MKLESFLAVSLAMAVAAPLAAAGTQLSEGKYMLNLSPMVNERTADKIEKKLGEIQEISSSDVKPENSSLHFTVKEDARLDVARLNKAIKQAAPNVSATEPVMDTEAHMGAPAQTEAQTSPGAASN